MSKSESAESESEEKVSSEGETDGENDEPTNQGEMPDYEKQRLQRIEENKSRMEALGLRKMASNFMGSVAKIQKKSSGKKGKRKIADEDEEYNPTQEDEGVSCSGDEDEDDDDEFLPSKKAKKVFIILVYS